MVPSSDKPSVSISEPDRMNLLGLMLGSLLERRMQTSSAMRHARHIKGDVAIDASGMKVTLRFRDGSIEVTRQQPARRPVASVRGTLVAMLDAALGRNRVRHVVHGGLIAWGRPDTLWHLLALMRA